MSKEKQIEEMALDICKSRLVAEDGDACRKCRQHNNCLYQEIAYGLYTAGYRKQSEGEWREEREYYDDDYSECNVRKVFACTRCGRTEKRKEPYCNCGAKMKGV